MIRRPSNFMNGSSTTVDPVAMMTFFAPDAADIARVINLDFTGTYELRAHPGCG